MKKFIFVTLSAGIFLLVQACFAIAAQEQWCIARVSIVCQEEDKSFFYCGKPDEHSDISFVFEGTDELECTQKFASISVLATKYQSLKMNKIYHAFVGIEKGGKLTSAVLNKLYFPDGNTMDSIPVNLKLNETLKEIRKEDRVKMTEQLNFKNASETLDLLKSELPYVDGKRHGKYKEYLQDGSLRQIGEFDMGVPIGKQLVFYKNGRVEFETIYENGTEKTIRHFTEDGTLDEETLIDDHETVINLYDDNGRLLSTKPMNQLSPN